MRSLVVELCGLPGSGKTTIARSVTDLLTGRGIPCEITDLDISAAAPRPLRVMRRLVSAGTVLGCDPAWAASSSRSFLRIPQGTPRDTAAPLVQWLAVAGLTSRVRESPGVHLLEEGLVQTMWTLLLRTSSTSGSAGQNLSSVTALMQRAPASVRSDVVILLDVPVESAAARLAARPSRHSRTQKLPVSRRTAELEHGRELMESLVATSAAPLHRLTAGDRGPADLAASVADVVLSRS